MEAIIYYVKVFPSSMGGHVSQIYAGLYELWAAKQIKLSFCSAPTPVDSVKTQTLLWVEAADSRHSKPVRICFDVWDGFAINKDILTEVDVYFKRSYDESTFAELDETSRKKVFPYGLNYACKSEHEFANIKVLQQLYALDKKAGRFASGPFTMLRSIARYPAVALVSRRVKSGSKAGTPFLSRDYEVIANTPADRKILFLTRVWTSESCQEMDSARVKQLNDTRADTVRLLRGQFGDKFIGGLYRNRLAEKEYPDCIYPYSTAKYNYMKLVKNNLIGVTSTGLHDSIGWKIGEYIAASRCIVTEPLKSTLPTPLEEGKHILTYNNPDQCAEACRRILDDPQFADQMRSDNEAYYSNEVKPAIMMRKRLSTALSLDEVLRG